MGSGIRRRHFRRAHSDGHVESAVMAPDVTTVDDDRRISLVRLRGTSA